jgi:hypothetical protein
MFRTKSWERIIWRLSRGRLVDRLVGWLDGRLSTRLSPSLDPLLSV